MPATNTTIIRSLSADEIQSFTREITEIPKNKWRKHYPIRNRTKLRDGESIHLNWISDEKYDFIREQKDQAPMIWKFIQDYLDSHVIGRAYIHRLKPGDSIIKHNDQVHVQSLKIISRYHIYLDIPDSVELFLDDKIEDNPQCFRFTISDFALSRDHYYKNNSDQNWYFIVFDKLEKNIHE